MLFDRTERHGPRWVEECPKPLEKSSTEITVGVTRIFGRPSGSASALAGRPVRDTSEEAYVPNERSAIRQ